MLPVLGMFIVIIFRLSLNSYYICRKYNNYHEENLVIIQNEGTTAISKRNLPVGVRFSPCRQQSRNRF